MAPRAKSKPKSSDVNPSEPESLSEMAAVELAQPEPEIKESFVSTTTTSSSRKATPKPQPRPTESVTLEITQLKFWQPSNAEECEHQEPKTTQPALQESQSKQGMVVKKNKGFLPGILHKEEPFQIEVSFQINGMEAIALTKKLLQQYHTQCFIQNRENRERIQLENCSVGTLIHGELTYTSWLPEMTLQQPGLYRLQVITQLAGGCASPGFFELPFLQVI